MIEAQVVSASTVDAKQEEALKLALLYCANGFGHETLGVLRMLMTDDPEMEKNPNIIALRGAAAALAGHYDEADDLKIETEIGLDPVEEGLPV